MRIPLLLSLLVLLSSLNSDRQEKLSVKELRILYKPLFKNYKATPKDELTNCCSYGYIRPNDDQYYEGFKGLFLYSNYVADGVNNLLKKKKINWDKDNGLNSFYNIVHFEKLSGHFLFMSRSPEVIDYQRSKPIDYFEKYNPDFILWVKTNLIPESNFSINGISAKIVYSHYSRFARLLTESYLFMLKNNSMDASSKKYISEVRNGKDGLDLLESMFSGKLNEYKIPINSEINAPFHDYMAFGFWLRRYQDKTYDEIFDLLKIIMNRFDQTWYNEVTKRYNYNS